MNNGCNQIMIMLILALILPSCLLQDNFESIPQKKITDAYFQKENNPIDSSIKSGIVIDKQGSKVFIVNSEDVYSEPLNNIAIIKYIDDSFIGIISGLPTIDAGWKYLVLPTYSNIVILDRNTLKTKQKKTIFESVSDLNIKNGQIYFEYGTYPDLKYGAFSLE